MQIEPKKIDEYNQELANAMNQLKGFLSQAQVIMGVVESFLYLVRKESKKITESIPAQNGSKNGDSPHA